MVGIVGVVGTLEEVLDTGGSPLSSRYSFFMYRIGLPLAILGANGALVITKHTFTTL